MTKVLLSQCRRLFAKMCPPVDVYVCGAPERSSSAPCTVSNSFASIEVQLLHRASIHPLLVPRIVYLSPTQHVRQHWNVSASVGCPCCFLLPGRALHTPPVLLQHSQYPRTEVGSSYVLLPDVLRRMASARPLPVAVREAPRAVRTHHSYRAGRSTCMSSEQRTIWCYAKSM